MNFLIFSKLLLSKTYLTFYGFAVIITLMAAPRVIGPSWRSIVTPMDMREIEGHQVHWESIVVLRSVHTATATQASQAVIEGFNTDEYRALLPIYFASIITSITKSYFWGETLSELFWWWLGTVSTFVLAKRLGCSRQVATVAGVLTATSPLGVAHMGALGFHTASSMALPVAALIAWDALNTQNRPPYMKILTVGFAIFVSSVTYTYQWVLIPWLCGLTVVAHRPLHWLATVVGGITTYVAITTVAQSVLKAGGLIARPHLNDPLAVIADRMRPLFGVDADQVSSFIGTLVQSLLHSVENIFFFFHPFIVMLALFGLIRVSKLHSIWFCISLFISIIQSAIYGLAWIGMTSFPILYISAGQGTIFLSNVCGNIFGNIFKISYHITYIKIIIIITCTLVATFSTNIDLFGYDNFVIRWWGAWHVPH